jgi:hypothetical protein
MASKGGCKVKICLFHKWKYVDTLADNGPLTTKLFGMNVKIHAALMQTERKCTKCGKLQFFGHWVDFGENGGDIVLRHERPDTPHTIPL